MVGAGELKRAEKSCMARGRKRRASNLEACKNLRGRRLKRSLPRSRLAFEDVDESCSLQRSQPLDVLQLRDRQSRHAVRPPVCEICERLAEVPFSKESHRIDSSAARDLEAA